MSTIDADALRRSQPATTRSPIRRLPSTASVVAAPPVVTEAASACVHWTWAVYSLGPSFAQYYYSMR